MSIPNLSQAFFLTIKQKTLGTFISEGLVSIQLLHYHLLNKPPVSYSIADGLNAERDPVQPLLSGN